MATNQYGLYKAIKRNGWEDILTEINKSNNPILKFDEVYKSYKELKDIRKVEKLWHTSYYKLRKLFKENNARFDGHKDIELTEEDEKEICKLIADGKSLTSVGKMFRIDKKRVKRRQL